MIITFIYKISNSSKYYGKYIGYISENYEEGLDIQLKHKLFPIFEKYYSLNDINEISIGILGFNRDSYDYFSEKEAFVFDFLYCDWTNEPKEIYLNNNKIDERTTFTI